MSEIGTPCSCDGTPGLHEAGAACTADECKRCSGTGYVTGGGQRALAGAVEECGSCEGQRVRYEPPVASDQTPDCVAAVPGTLEVTASGCLLPPNALTYYAPPADPYATMAREFLTKMGKTVRSTPDLGSPQEREERVARMLEELLEVAEALGVSVRSAEDNMRFAQVNDFTFAVERAPILPAALREMADLQVTVSGTAAMFGLPLLPAVREVHRANMEKLPSGPSGKPVKPEGWRPPDVSGLVSAALQDAPGAMLRQLAGADPSQPGSAVLPDPLRPDPDKCNRSEHRVNGFCGNCCDGWL